MERVRERGIKEDSLVSSLYPSRKAVAFAEIGRTVGDQEEEWAEETMGPALDTLSVEASRKMTSADGCVDLESGKRSPVSLLFFFTHHTCFWLFHRID